MYVNNFFPLFRDLKTVFFVDVVSLPHETDEIVHYVISSNYNKETANHIAERLTERVMPQQYHRKPMVIKLKGYGGLKYNKQELIK